MVYRASVDIERVYEDSANLPVTVTEAKLYAKIDHDTEDAMIATQLAAAAEIVEAYLCRALFAQTITLNVDGFNASSYGVFLPKHVIYLARPPIISVTSIAFYDTDNASTVFSSSNYLLDPSLGRVGLNSGESWQASQRQIRALAVEYEAGYGAVADIPAPIKEAIKVVFSNIFYGCQGTALNDLAKAILNPYRILRPSCKYFGVFEECW